MTPLSDKRSLKEVQLQHQISSDKFTRKSWNKQKFHNQILEFKGYKRNPVEVLYPVTERSHTILFS